jgi:ADP-heptose:LPS heptosyltransferase
MQRELDLRSFLAVISKSSLFISNSTGPLHCAVSLGVNTLSFFPNKKNEGIKRWGPFNANSCEHLVFTPKTSNEKEKNDCMNSIDKDIVLTRILEKVGL